MFLQNFLNFSKNYLKISRFQFWGTALQRQRIFHRNELSTLDIDQNYHQNWLASRGKLLSGDENF